MTSGDTERKKKTKAGKRARNVSCMDKPTKLYEQAPAKDMCAKGEPWRSGNRINGLCGMLLSGWLDGFRLEEVKRKGAVRAA